MNHFTQALATGIALLALNVQAASMTHEVKAGDPFSQISASWDVSPQGTAFFNSVGGHVSGTGGATIAAQRNERSKYTRLAVHDLQLASFTYDNTTGQLLNAHFTGGVFIQSLKDGFGIDDSLGKLENLHIDLEGGKVLATIEAFGLMGPHYPATEIALWGLENASGQVGPSGQFEMSLPSLALTQEGVEALSSALLLYEDDHITLSKVTSFGAITAVPEPGTYVLMGIGLVACWAALRRRHAL